MILGRISGTITTNSFSFVVMGDVKKYDFVQVYHPDYGYVLCQVVELSRTRDGTLASGIILGYRNKRGNIAPIRTPFAPGTEVLMPEPDVLQKVVSIGTEEGAYIGFLQGTSIPVKVDLNKLLTGHIAVLAKSGSGKSYALGVLLEELLERGVPAVVFDPHGEYSSLRFPSSSKDAELFSRFNVTPKGYFASVNFYGDTSVERDAKPILLNDSFGQQELLRLFPIKLSSAQQALLLSVFSSSPSMTIDEIMLALEQEQSPQKHALLAALSALRNSGIFARKGTPLTELVQPGKISVVSLKGFKPELQELIVSKLSSDIFEARKKGDVPPLLLAFEEAHNFVPERGFGDSKCSPVVRAIVSEGRKFGLGVAVVSQRPALIQKTVLSQCSTLIILKMSNPNDIRAILSAVEGVSSEAEAEIRSLPVGTALLLGIAEVPVFVAIRPRRSLHGGQAVNVLQGISSGDSPSQGIQSRAAISSALSREILPVVLPSISFEDRALIHGSASSLRRVLFPCYAFVPKEEPYSRGIILLDRVSGLLVTDTDTLKERAIPDMSSLSNEHIALMKELFRSPNTMLNELASKLKIAEERLNSIVSRLSELGYIVSSSGKLSLSPDYVFTTLKNHVLYRLPEHREVVFEEKKSPVFALPELKKLVEQSVAVSDVKECYLLAYIGTDEANA